MTGFIALCLFLGGCVIGAITHKLLSSRSGTASRLSQNLDNVSQEFADYQDKVNTHFHETAELVHNLTQNYAAVHQKLAQGAQELSRSSLPPITVKQEEPKSLENQSTDDKITAPRDYPEPETQN